LNPSYIHYNPSTLKVPLVQNRIFQTDKGEVLDWRGLRQKNDRKQTRILRITR